MTQTTREGERRAPRASGWTRTPLRTHVSHVSEVVVRGRLPESLDWLRRLPAPVRRVGKSFANWSASRCLRIAASRSDGVARIRREMSAPVVGAENRTPAVRWPTDVTAPTDREANQVLADIEYATGCRQLRSAPHHLRVAVSEHCNVSCIMCRVSVDPDDFKSYLSDDARRQIERLLPVTDTVTFAEDAEPFHHFATSPVKRLVDATDPVDGPTFVATTNGLLMNDEVCDVLLDRFARIRVSVDSPDPDVYESIRVHSSFERVRHHIEYLRDLKIDHGRGRDDAPTIHINYLVMDRTFRGIVDFVELANTWHVQEIRLSPMRVNFDPTLADEDIFTDPWKLIELADLMAEVHRRAAGYGIDIIDRASRPLRRALAAHDLIPPGSPRTDDQDRLRRMPVCPAPWGDLWIGRDGGARFCLQGTPIGNVNEASIHDVYNSETAGRIREAFVDGDYGSCKREQCPRGIHNVGTKRGDPPVDAETQRVEIARRGIYTNVGWS